MPNLGLYLHIPFCAKKCTYCDFYSITNTKMIDNYLSNLCKEITLRAEISNADFINKFAQKPIIDSIFFGGGTPSILSPKQIEKVLHRISNEFQISENAEITMECNPGASDAKHFADYRCLGVNRLSIGVQSFVDEELLFLDRIHNAQAAIETITTAQKSFDNLSIDLIFAIPGQSTKSLSYSIAKANEFDLQHISCYSLIFEEGTPLFNDLLSGKTAETDDDESAEMYMMMCETIENNGFEQYEISNFAKNGFRSRHNLKYWQSEDVLAFGTSSVGLALGRRYRNFPDIVKYNSSLGVGVLPESEFEFPTLDDRLTETIFLSLRSIGIDFHYFKNTYDIDLESIAKDEIDQLISNSFAKIENGRLKLRAKGYYICDEITLRILRTLEDKDNA